MMRSLHHTALAPSARCVCSTCTLGVGDPSGQRRLDDPQPLAAEPETDWLPASKNLSWFPCAKYHRTLARDNTVRCGSLIVDIPPTSQLRSFAGRTIELHEPTDGSARAWPTGA